MTDPAVDSCKGMWRRAADEGMGLWIWKGGNGPCGADPLGPALCLCWLVTSLPFLLLRYSFQDYLQPWPQCSCKLQILFSLSFFPLSLLTLISCQRGSVIYGIVCWNFNLDSLVSLNEGRIITVSSGKTWLRMNWDVQGIVQPKIKLLVIIYSPLWRNT